MCLRSGRKWRTDKMCWKRDNRDVDGSDGYENGGRKEGEKKRLWQSRDSDKVRGRDKKKEREWERKRDWERIIWPSPSLSLINDLGREALRSPVHEHTRRFNSTPGVSASPPLWWRAARSLPHISPFSHLSLITVRQACKCEMECLCSFLWKHQLLGVSHDPAASGVFLVL